jgi:hypothetical protein
MAADKAASRRSTGVRKIFILPAIIAGLGIAASVAHAAMIRINLSNQTMYVTSKSGDYTWPISSARSGFVTPRGSYGVQRMEAMHYSHEYHNSPMPHSIFFRGGYAIHGTYATNSLGAPASHGCVRLSPGNAALLYQIVRHEGARIAVTGAPSEGPRYASAARRPYRRVAAYRGYGRVRAPLAYAPTYDAGYAPAPGLNDWLRAPAGYPAPSSGYGYDPGGDDQQPY